MDELRSERPFRLTEIHASAAEKLKELESTLRGGIAEHLGNHPKPAIDNHFKTGHREAA